VRSVIDGIAVSVPRARWRPRASWCIPRWTRPTCRRATRCASRSR